jgi:aerobic-type carbon monoxide dehydrogenase small subunit (CoxS/CutS family)
MSAPTGQTGIEVALTVNGEARSARVDPRMLLSDFLRHGLGLTGTHVGCEHGVCGACTVLVDGRTVRSCLLFAAQADGADVETIEGLAGRPEEMHPLQRAFWEHHGLQCGFCTPAMILTAKELLAANPDPTDDEIREAIAGNICRCTGYTFIVEAIRSAAREMAAADGAEAPADG